MEAKLRVLAGPLSGQAIKIPLGKLLVGREADCDWRPESRFVSARHCVLLWDEHTLRIRDLGSKNGTLVNGRRIGSSPVKLRPGDLLEIGDLYALVAIGQTAATTPPEMQISPPALAPMLPPTPAPTLPPTLAPGLSTALGGTSVFQGDTVQTEIAQGDTVQAEIAKVNSPDVSQPVAPPPVSPPSAPAPIGPDESPPSLEQNPSRRAPNG